MTFRQVLFPVAIAWTVVNLIGLGMAAVAGEPVHGAVHVVFAVAFGWWAMRLRQPHRAKERDPRVDALEDEISDLQRELNEAQQGLDFAEQLLAKRPEPLRMDPQRYAPRPPDNLEPDRPPATPDDK